MLLVSYDSVQAHTLHKGMYAIAGCVYYFSREGVCRSSVYPLVICYYYRFFFNTYHYLTYNVTRLQRPKYGSYTTRR